MKRISALDLTADPFAERSAALSSRRVQVLGGEFEFETESRRLLRLVDTAYGGLPAHGLARRTPHFRVRLRLVPDAAPLSRDEPPGPTLHSGAGFLCGTVDSANFAIVSPRQRAGLVVVSPGMLAHPYHVRYELIEFAVYTLAARAQELVSLHAACIGRNGRGLLLIGSSGTGKSTLALLCSLQGMELLAEDGVFVKPETLRATGLGSFLHLREDSLRFLQDAADRASIRKSPVIRRRSGVEKFEVDMRGARYRIAQAPLEIAAVVFLSKQSAAKRGAGGAPLLAPLGKSDLLAKLKMSQPYAANQPGWGVFSKHVSRLSSFELRRGRHPLDAVDALQALLAGSRRNAAVRESHSS
jgi:hypothetical protein